MYTNHPVLMGNWPHRLFRLAKLLSPSSRQSAVILQIRLPAQDRTLELGGRHYPKFLFECPIWSKLEL